MICLAIIKEGKMLWPTNENVVFEQSAIFNARIQQIGHPDSEIWECECEPTEPFIPDKHYPGFTFRASKIIPTRRIF